MSLIYLGTIASSRPQPVITIPDAGSVGLIPDGYGTPLLWFSADSVVVDGSGNITTYINKGSGGTSMNATANTTNYATVGDLNGKAVSLIPSTSTGGYTIGGSGAGTMITGFATYKDGIDSLFDSYDGYMSGSLQMTGGQNSASWFSGQPANPVKNGANNAVVLPCLNATIGAYLNSATPVTVTRLFQDDDSTSRNWKGMSGDILVYNDQEYTEADMLAFHNQAVIFYGL